MGDKVNKAFWKNKNVLITGYRGFLGSHITKTLLDTKAKITGVDRISQSGKTILTPNDYDRIHIILGDITDYAQIANAINGNKINVIFHIAAKALVGECLDNPLDAFTTNIQGTWNVLEAARNCKTVKAVIVSSSDKAYGDNNELPYKEGHPLQGNHPYDVSKSCADLLAETYHHTYGLPVCVTRCGNIHGPGDYNFSRIIPETIKSALQDTTLNIRSDGKPTRDYTYIEDIVNGYILIAEYLQRLLLAGHAFNLSGENPVSVIDIVKLTYKLMGKKPNYKILNQAKYEIQDQYLSAKKAHILLGWKPKYSLEEGLIKTIDWLKGTINEK